NIDHIASFKSRERMTDILALAQAENIKPAQQDKKRTLLLAIDVQHDFMEDVGSLAVPGSKGDVQRLTQWMYRNMESLTQVICSRDCHSMMQLVPPASKLGPARRHPRPFTITAYTSVANGTSSVANGETERSLESLRNFASGDKRQLCIWP